MPSRSKRASQTNAAIADQLERIAELLEAQDANAFRVRAYRNAATTLRGLDRPVAEILETGGVAGLQELPNIGEGLAGVIAEAVDTGRSSLLEQLRGDTGPERVLASVGGIGPSLAQRIHEQLGIETLAELEAAANDGRLASVPGFGKRRVQAVREALAGRFVRGGGRAGASTRRGGDPPVGELLDVDREYRERAAAGTLRRIAPKRFNPRAEAWLPVLHTRRGDAEYTALFSNTARAHELGTTDDWVVIYRERGDDRRQWTVVTAQGGRQGGKRVVRGREDESADSQPPG